MKYALLIYGDEATAPQPGTEAAEKEMSDYLEFSTSIMERGIYLGGEPLHWTSSATTVRVRDGETLTSDGPFAETKESLGGFYLIDVADLDEAISVAADLPGSWTGSVEIRPVMVFEDDVEDGDS